jgi:hypothetical protein
VHEHLGQIRAVGLVLGLIEQQLDGAAHPLIVLGDQQGPLPRSHPLRHPPPEGDGPLPAERMHEADRGAPLDAVDQHLGQPIDLGIIDGEQAAG